MESQTQRPQVSWIMPFTFDVFFINMLNIVLPRLDHLVYDQAPVLNPLKQACYQDEDCVGQIKKLCAKSHPNKLGHQVLQRYSAFVCCRWLRQLTDWSHTINHWTMLLWDESKRVGTTLACFKKKSWWFGRCNCWDRWGMIVWYITAPMHKEHACVVYDNMLHIPYIYCMIIYMLVKGCP